MGAWIETYMDNVFEIVVKSRPTWARGLKLTAHDDKHLRLQSRPTWARGLKQISNYGNSLANYVAPHVGAWIETRSA